MLKRLTFEEKWPNCKVPTPATRNLMRYFSAIRQKWTARSATVGIINPDFDATAAQTISLRNALQNFLKKKTRVGILTLFIDEVYQGLLSLDADVFPTSIAIACSWNTTLIKNVYTYIAAETR